MHVFMYWNGHTFAYHMKFLAVCNSIYIPGSHILQQRRQTSLCLYLGILGLFIFHSYCYRVSISNICLHPALSSVMWVHRSYMHPMLVDTHAKPPRFSSLFALADILTWPQQSFQHRQLTCPSSAFDPTQQTHSFYSNKTLEVFFFLG